MFAWDGEVLRCDAAGILLRAIFNLPRVDLGFVAFCQGDVFHEFYYWDRWYNVFEVSAPDGMLKGWYGNVGSPAVLDAAAGDLSYADWALDVWVAPSGEYRVLDEEEFAACLADPSHPAAAVEGAGRGRDALLALAEARHLPRWSEERSQTAGPG